MAEIRAPKKSQLEGETGQADLRKQFTSCGIGTEPEDSPLRCPHHSLTISQRSGRSTGFEVRPELKSLLCHLLAVTQASYETSVSLTSLICRGVESLAWQSCGH